jgi:hypothetical protein
MVSRSSSMRFAALVSNSLSSTVNRVILHISTST